MKYETASAFRAALEQRLVTMAQATGVPLIRLRTLVVFDRVLARLTVIAPHRWILKGAVALLFRAGPQFRTTKDLDLGRQDSEEAATADFLAAQAIDLSDYFSFVIHRTKQFDPVRESAAARYHITAELAGRPFEDVTVDIGFDEPQIADAEWVRGPELLSFAGIPPIDVPALRLEQHVAEKVHAYTRSYAGGHSSTRVKDLIDLVWIPSLFSLQAGRLYEALQVTFTARGTHPLPATFPPPPPQWRLAYAKIAAELRIARDVTVGYEQARTFLDPILAGTFSSSARWDPRSRAW